MEKIKQKINELQNEFDKLPLFQQLRNPSLNAEERLAFAPHAAPFIMFFGELNRDILRDEPTDDPIQDLVNRHTHEDETHWQWLLSDLQKLGQDTPQKYSDMLRFLWGDSQKNARVLSNELYRLSTEASPKMRFVIIEAIEATSSIFINSAQAAALDLKKEKDIELQFFGHDHHAVDSDHSIHGQLSEEVKALITFDQGEEREAFEKVERVFEIFTGFAQELFQQTEKSKTLRKPQEISRHHETLVIGAGPAGLQLGYYFKKYNRDYAILEGGNSPGMFLKQYPRHRKLISINKRFTGYKDPEVNLRWDWNSLISDNPELLFTKYDKDYFPNADSIVHYLSDYARAQNLNIHYNTRVSKVSKDPKSGLFTVEIEGGKKISCDRLVVAAGCSKLYLPDIPGIELAESYDTVSVDPEDFEDQRVLIVGKGNSAFETGDNLVGAASLIHLASPSTVRMAWQTRYVGNLRAVNNNILDTYQLKSQNALVDAEIKRIEKNGERYQVSYCYSHASGEEEVVEYDRIIFCTGFRFDDSIFADDCKPEMAINNRFPQQTSEWESTNIKDLYFAGILMHMRDFKKKQSGFIHGFRYNISVLCNILEKKYHKRELPNVAVEASAAQLTKHILERVNRSSSLWQQTGFICDYVHFTKNEGARYTNDVTFDYIRDSELGKSEKYLTVSLEFAADVASIQNPFAIERVHKDDAENAHLSTAIHPIVRLFNKGEMLAEHHVIEDFFSEWMEDVHRSPLFAFLQSHLNLPENKLQGASSKAEAGEVKSSQREGEATL